MRLWKQNVDVVNGLCGCAGIRLHAADYNVQTSSMSTMRLQLLHPSIPFYRLNVPIRSMGRVVRLRGVGEFDGERTCEPVGVVLRGTDTGVAP